MAHLTPLWTADPVSDPASIRSLLAERGIQYDRWDLPERVTSLASQSRLTDEDKTEVLSHFQSRLEELGEASGYKSADVIAVRSDFPGVDDALAKFDKVHYHDDDEIRAIVGGAGVFGFISDDGRQLLLKVEAGDYISVPAGMWHWFYCLEDKNITALRLFRDPAGWVAHYRDTARGTPTPTA